MPRTHLALLLATAGLLFFACAVGRVQRPSVPVQSWWAGDGPVVPHDRFPSDCSLCHTSDSWSAIRPDFSFDHESETGLRLNGAHAHAQCLRCHNDRGPVQVFSNKGCAGCHEDVHEGELGHDCSACHDENDWRPDELIALHDRTRLPLQGAHASTACWRCHPGAQVGEFRNVDPECATCHLDEYQRTSAPDHALGGFPLTCQECHGFVTWQGASFSHQGIHDGCVDCHLDDYQATTDPDHELGGFPLTCEDCHQTTQWQGAFFSHQGITTGCAECHLDDYQATSEPDHQAFGFPTACEFCHTPTDWSMATFDHPFPIQSGPHKVACSTCHTVPADPAVFTCLVCHAHAESEMNHEHREVRAYVYESSACYECHPRGRAD